MQHLKAISSKQSVNQNQIKQYRDHCNLEDSECTSTKIEIFN